MHAATMESGTCTADLSRQATVSATRLGVVRYLNTRPLIAGLESLGGLHMRAEVPAELIGTIERGEVDAALCSSIDYQRSSHDLVILPVGLLGSAGATLTVKVFSRVPLAQVRRLHADADSHTSRVLAGILFAERFNTRVELVDGLPDDLDASDAEAVLLIGDKVVLRAPDARRFPHEMDLGHAWHDMTGLPFTFACWMAPRPRDAASLQRLHTLAQVLDHQRRRNAQRLACLAAVEGRARGWPAEVAHRYLCELLRFDWNDAQRRGLELFWSKADAHGLQPTRRSLALLEPSCRPVRACD